MYELLRISERIRAQSVNLELESTLLIKFPLIRVAISATSIKPLFSGQKESECRNDANLLPYTEAKRTERATQRYLELYYERDQKKDITFMVNIGILYYSDL